MNTTPLAHLIRDFDWSTTELGPMDQWTPIVRLTTSLILASPVPMVLLWGRDGYMIYNDAYATFAGGRHPSVLGSRVREAWPEAAAFNDTVMNVVLGGGTLSYRDEKLLLHRAGAAEPVWLNLDYSPVRDEAGMPVGVMAIVAETTERVLAEERLRSRQQRQQELLQRMPGFVAMLRGPEHRYEYLNDAYSAVSGRRDFLGRPVREVFPELEGQGFFELLDQVYTTGERYSARGVEIQLQTDTSNRYIDLLYEPVRNEAGRVTGIFVSGYDVTDARVGAAALAKSAEHLRLVIEGARDHAIMTMGADGVMRSWSTGAQALFRWEASEIIGKPFTRLAEPASRAALVLPPDFHVASDRGGSQYEQWLVSRSGERLFISGSVHPLRLGAGESLQEYLLIACDETDRRRSEDDLKELTGVLKMRMEEQAQALHDSQDFARLALTAVGGVGVWTYDAATDVFFYDEAIGTLYGIDVPSGRTGLPRTDFLQNVHPADRGILAATMSGGLNRPGDLELEYRLVHADGSIHWVLSRGHTYFDDAGQPVRRTGIGVEMTKQRVLEEQFRQAQKMEAVGQLTGGLAHDFNNLLTGITGSLEMIQARLASGRTADLDRYMVAAQGAARRAAALTHRLLAFSRRQTLDPENVDANRLVADMVELTRRTVGPQVTIEVVAAAGLWQILVDGNQLENALLNLCINARDAMPVGGRITIETANRIFDERIATAHDVPPGEYVSVSVTDSGAGMPPDVIARAFDPFFTTKPLGQGTGLGLSMVYGFVRQSGGQVRIYSEVGMGTTVTLYLPRDPSQAEAIEPTVAVEATRSRGEGQVILIVDDEPTIRMLIVDVLEESGYTLLEAEDGPSGMKLIQSGRRIDLLITDVGLPGGMNGRQIADAARSMRSALKVLFITGYAENAIIGNGHLEAGMEVVTKPFGVEDLAQRVQRMLKEPVPAQGFGGREPNRPPA